MRWNTIKFHFLLAHPSQTQKTNFVRSVLEGMPHDCFVIWESVIFDQFTVVMFATWFPFYLKMTLLQDFVSFVLLFQIFPFLLHLIQWATISLRVGEDRSEDRIWMQTNLSLSPPISPLPIVWVKYSSNYNLSSSLSLLRFLIQFRTLPYFPLSSSSVVRPYVTGVTSQLSSIIWWFRPGKPYIFWLHII